MQWWDDDVIVRFKDKAQCIVDQYSKYLVPEANLTVSTDWFEPVTNLILKCPESFKII